MRKGVEAKFVGQQQGSGGEGFGEGHNFYAGGVIWNLNIQKPPGAPVARAPGEELRHAEGPSAEEVAGGLGGVPVALGRQGPAVTRRQGIGGGERRRGRSTDKK